MANSSRSNSSLADMNVLGFVPSGLQWPNKISKHDDFFVIPDGFLVPGKSNGNIFLAKGPGTGHFLAGELHRITKQQKAHFYHMVFWHDFNGDGHDDILTARCIEGGVVAPSFKGELVLLMNPGPATMFHQEWEERVIAEGPDVIIAAIPHRDGLAVFSAEFFAERLTVRFLNSRGEVVEPTMRIIDDTIGRVFSVDVVDLDGDGEDELLVTNHVSDESLSGVYAYEIPPTKADGTRDLEAGNFTKHIIATGFKTKFSLLPGGASPGFSYAFHPEVGASGPRHILVEGDGSHEVVHLSPRAGVRLVYDRELVADVGGTTGSLLIQDLTGDGIVDVLVPNNDDHKLTAFTFVCAGRGAKAEAFIV